MQTIDVGVQHEQRVIVKFIVAEGVASVEIYRSLSAVGGVAQWQNVGL